MPVLSDDGDDDTTEAQSLEQYKHGGAKKTSKICREEGEGEEEEKSCYINHRNERATGGTGVFES